MFATAIQLPVGITVNITCCIVYWTLNKMMRNNLCLLSLYYAWTRTHIQYEGAIWHAPPTVSLVLTYAFWPQYFDAPPPMIIFYDTDASMKYTNDVYAWVPQRTSKETGRCQPWMTNTSSQRVIHYCHINTTCASCMKCITYKAHIVHKINKETVKRDIDKSHELEKTALSWNQTDHVSLTYDTDLDLESPVS